MEHVEAIVSELELAKRAYTLFSAGDIPAFLELLHDEVVFEIMGKPDVPYAGIYSGKEELMTLFKRLEETVEFQKFEPVEFIVDGDTIAVVISSEEVVRSNGKFIAGELVHILKFKDGACISLRDFSDTNMVVKSLD